jgi:hypothetical protein
MDRQEIHVKEGENRIRVSVSEHSFVEVRKDTGEWMATQKTNAGEVFIGLPPGTYIVESDGKIGSIEAEHFEIKLP